MNGALSKEIENGSKMSKNSGLSWLVIFFGARRSVWLLEYVEGTHVGSMRQGRAQGGGRALDPRGLELAPPDVFSVPDILKYSRKNYIKFAGYLENFYFRGIFLLHG